MIRIFNYANRFASFAVDKTQRNSLLQKRSFIIILNRTKRLSVEGKVLSAVAQTDNNLYIMWRSNDLQKLVWINNVLQKLIGLEFEHLGFDTGLTFLRRTARPLSNANKYPTV